MRIATTYAGVAATLALIISLGGTSFAFVHLGRNAVHRQNIAAGAVDSRAVRNGSIHARDLNLRDIRTALGNTTSGAAAHTPQIVSTVVPADAYGFAHGDALCPSGSSAVGGGAAWDGPALGSDTLMQSRPIDGGGGWHAELNAGNNARANKGATATIYAVCLVP
jgi:hypothetical protein